MVDRLRRTVLAAAAAHLAPDAALRRRHLERTSALLDRLEGSLPPVLHVVTPSGYAYHAVDPDAYALAARAYRAEVGARAGDAVALGVRSIGTSLSAVVAAACGARASYTLRPHGAPGGARVEAEPELEARLRDAARAGADVLLVDEPAGLARGSLAAVLAWLTALGVPARSVVLFPGPCAPRAGRPEEEGAGLDGLRRYSPPDADARPIRIAERLGWLDPRDLSCGRWRARFRRGERLPAWAAGERVKHLARDAGGGLWQIRFAGVGRWGRRLAARAERLAEAGAGVEPAGLADGFLLLPWVQGLPLRRGRRAPPELLRDAARYLAARGEALRTGEAVRTQWVVRLLAENGRAAGVPGPALARAVRRLKRVPEREAVIADARLRPWEWLRTRRGWVKVDALDHGEGFRAPGPCDVAWDLAGLAVELRLAEGDHAEIVRSCARRWGERERHLAQAVAAYRPVYAATCWAEAALAAAGAPEPDDLLSSEQAFYQRALMKELRVPPASRRRRPRRPPPAPAPAEVLASP